MPIKSTTALATPLRDQLDRLAAFEPVPWPVLSLYLDLQPDQHGRHNYASFLRKVFPARSRAFAGEARRSFDEDAARIREYLDRQVPSSANALAVFACAGAGGFFEAVQLDVPLEQHWLFVGAVPHLYPLARLNDQFPRYAALLVDTNSARLFVFSGLGKEATTTITNVKTRRGGAGWAQARYQRNVEHLHVQHMKEVAHRLDRVVQADAIQTIVVACDAVTRPLLMEQLPKHVAARIVDVLQLDINAPEHRVMAETLDALRRHDAETDAERVGEMLDAWCASGLAVAGPDETLDALTKGQVEELLITARPDALSRPEARPAVSASSPLDADTSSPNAAIDPDLLKAADEFVARAQRQGARIRFIEDPALLAGVGGVGALLRFRI